MTNFLKHVIYSSQSDDKCDACEDHDNEALAARDFELTWELSRIRIDETEDPVNKAEVTRREAKRVRRILFTSLGDDYRKALYGQFMCANEGCDRMATSNCSRCKNMYYCCKSCLDLNWPVHREVCLPVNQTMEDPSEQAAGEKAKK